VRQEVATTDPALARSLVPLHSSPLSLGRHRGRVCVPTTSDAPHLPTPLPARLRHPVRVTWAKWGKIDLFRGLLQILQFHPLDKCCPAIPNSQPVGLSHNVVGHKPGRIRQFLFPNPLLSNDLRRRITGSRGRVSHCFPRNSFSRNLGDTVVSESRHTDTQCSYIYISA
jgi:hypothetical protein